jgi:hypothetical protein
MPAQQVVDPASVHGTLSLTARCNDVQCCSHCTLIIVVGNDEPTQAELTAQADWDEIDLQVKSMISMRLSLNLRTLIGTTSTAMWTNLDQHYGVPHFTRIYKEYELAHSIRLTTGESPEIQIQKIWTILERLWANRCVLSNYLQGMLLLKAIPKEWDTIVQLYCNNMQMANIIFDGVWDTIMAEFERTAHPAQLAHCYNPVFRENNRSKAVFFISSVSFNVSTTVSLSVSHVVSPFFQIHESVSFSDVFPSVLPIVTCRILIHVSYLYLTWN